MENKELDESKVVKPIKNARLKLTVVSSLCLILLIALACVSYESYQAKIKAKEQLETTKAMLNEYQAEEFRVAKLKLDDAMLKDMQHELRGLLIEKMNIKIKEIQAQKQESL